MGEIGGYHPFQWYVTYLPEILMLGVKCPLEQQYGSIYLCAMMEDMCFQQSVLTEKILQGNK